MAFADSALRVVVSGIRKGPVTRYDKGIVEEDNLGYFFYDRDCNVESVRLVIDSKRGDASRGFGFVDFSDQESFQRALDLDGTKVPDIAGKDGCLHIEAARPATEETKRKQQELLKTRKETEQMECELRFREARVTELMREVQRKRELQNVMGLTAQLEEESARQEAIQRAQESLRVVEETLHRVIGIEEERTKAMEAIACSIDGEQTRPHQEAAAAEPDFHLRDETGAATGAAGAAPPSDSNAEDPFITSKELQVRVRNTFIEYYVPTNFDGLMRTKTAPPEFLSSAQRPPEDDEDNPGGTLQRSAAVSQVSPPSEPTGPNPGQQEQERDGAITGDAERPRWSSMVDDTEPGALAPWVLRREVSMREVSAEVSRAILEDKMGGLDAPRASTSTSAVAKVPAASTQVMSSGGVAIAETMPMDPVRAAPERRRVRLRNVPPLPDEELKGLLAEELAHLWKAARGRPPPHIEAFHVALNPSSRTFAQVAAGTQVEVVFTDAEDAAWLVDGRQPAAWSSAETLMLRGRVLEVEWVAPAPVDWRRLRYTADTDACSNISYGTLGTRQSFSSKFGERERTEGSRLQAGQQAGSTSGRTGATGPPRNRTIVLEGLPTSWPVHQVRDEVISLLRKLWQRDGLTFDPREQLHHGGGGGIEVRPGRKKNEENSGTCLVRLRSYLDAKWLVESGSRLSVGGGTQLWASWARPRQGGK